MAKMKPALKWALIIGGLGVTGVAGYFIWKRIKNKRLEAQDKSEATKKASVTESQVKTSSYNKKPSYNSGAEATNTPFKNSTEGNKFRAWVNDTYPQYAKKIDLDREGSYNNAYIQKAWKEYGTEYQDQVGGVTTLKYGSDFGKLLADWKKSVLVNASGTPYFKLNMRSTDYGGVTPCDFTIYVFDRADGEAVGGKDGFGLWKFYWGKNLIATGRYDKSLTSLKVTKVTDKGDKSYQGTTISGGKGVGDKFSKIWRGVDGKLSWC